MSNSGRQRGGGSPHMNEQRVERAAAKLDTPGIGVPADYPLPARVKRQALVAPQTFQAIPSRLSRAQGTT